MTVDIIRDVWVCSDCIMAIANGEHSSPEHDAAFAAGCKREAPYVFTPDGPATGRHAPECEACDGTGVDDGRDDGVCRKCEGAGKVDEHEEADQQPFSWSECDCCGSQLGGSRHRCALIRSSASEQTPKNVACNERSGMSSPSTGSNATDGSAP